jgi:adenosylmethionine-8-amino-7-oxononanoate aminotransferase
MSLIERDRAVVWHPFTQMKTAIDPIPIVRGKGAYLFDEEDNRYIDAISSWWVTVHGHAHPYIAEKVYEQIQRLEHVIFAGFTHPKAIEVAERVLPLLPGDQSRVFFSDNGSTAVEVGLKMAFQYWYNLGAPKRKVIALEGAYHGDTFGAMSVGARGSFNIPFESFMFDVDFIPVPNASNFNEVKAKFEALLKDQDVAAFIFEPLVQGSAGMVMYEPELLNELVRMAKANEAMVIADEVMTGFGRTGKYFAMEYLQEQADIVAMSKGVSGGTLAIGLTACTDKIYDAFLSEDKMKTFFHGHSFTANPVACAAICASLDIFEKQETWDNVNRIAEMHSKFAAVIATNAAVENTRNRGAILAIELKTGENTSYFNNIRDQAYQYFLERGIIMRPLGNIIYVMPPYCISTNDLEFIYETIEQFLDGLEE